MNAAMFCVLPIQLHLTLVNSTLTGTALELVFNSTSMKTKYVFIELVRLTSAIDYLLFAVDHIC